MNTFVMESSKIINARAEAAYAVLRDYRVGHPAILPKPYFQQLDVEQGGVGEGTVFRLIMQAFGQQYHYHMRVTEPEPGRVLQEQDVNTGLASRFIVEPVGQGDQARVTIQVEMAAPAGIAGKIQQFIQSRVSRGIFNTELNNLEAYLRDQAASTASQPHAARS
jgi:hypothetical protein